MSRWIGVFICAALGVLVIICGLQVPAHLRAVDGRVLERAGHKTPAVVDAGLALVRSNQLGPAQLLLAAARNARLTNSHQLGEAIENAAARRPALRILGSAGDPPLGAFLESLLSAAQLGTNAAASRSEPFTEFIIRGAPRTKVLTALQVSPDPLVQAFLRLRAATNTVLFPAAATSSGQALEAAIAIGGLLAEGGHLTSGVSATVIAGVRSGDPRAAEDVLMSLLSLGQRFNWGQLAAFVAPINDARTLQALSDVVRRGDAVPEVFTAVCLSRNAAGVARYLETFSQTGRNDLRSSLRYGAGGVTELVQRRQQLCNSHWCEWVAHSPFANLLAGSVDYARMQPASALAIKWLLYLFGGFLLAAAFHFSRQVTDWERPLQVRGIRLARESLFALGFLLVVLLLSEPYLSQDSQKASPSFRLRLPTVGSVAPAASSATPAKIMNQLSLMALLLFFVLQSLIYTACLIKLAEIRRQRVSPRLRLKLLDNEDHLFDAGLYLGFVGTIISLILVSLGVIKPSLMAAYSSTSFGILFVSIFKIFHLRPLRRRLLLEAEGAPGERPAAPLESAAPQLS